MKPKSIAIFTTTRAEFGLFTSLLDAIHDHPDLNYLLFVGGTHLSEKHGYTINEINEGGYKVTHTFDYLTSEESEYDLAKSVATATQQIAGIFNKYDFEFICVLGDRYELLSIIYNAILFKKPIIHIHGGERSEGVIDEQIRHMVTKSAHIHFVACEEYQNNVRSMGEESWRIHNTGALGIDNIVNKSLLTKEGVFEKYNLDKLKKTILFTYHPVTLEKSISPKQQITNIFNALKPYNFQVIITGPARESGRDELLMYIQEQIQNNPYYHYVESLGIKNYQSIIPHCEFIIGNSSSGIIEIPFFKIPTINIGERQRGRFMHQSIITTDYSEGSIKSAIELALNNEFRDSLKSMGYRFGDGNAARRMVEVISTISINKELVHKTLNFPK